MRRRRPQSVFDGEKNIEKLTCVSGGEPPVEKQFQVLQAHGVPPAGRGARVALVYRCQHVLPFVLDLTAPPSWTTPRRGETAIADSVGPSSSATATCEDGTHWRPIVDAYQRLERNWHIQNASVAQMQGWVVLDCKSNMLCLLSDISSLCSEAGFPIAITNPGAGSSSSW